MKTDYTTEFLNTTYRILESASVRKTIDLKIGSTNPDLNVIFPGVVSWAFITAWNPLPDILSYEENQKRSIQLQDELAKLNLKTHKAIGISACGSWSEESLFIENISLAQAQAISKQFGQLAFVFGEMNAPAQLVYTTEKA